MPRTQIIMGQMLLQRTELREDESLPSLMLRLAILNGLEDDTLIRKHIEPQRRIAPRRGLIRWVLSNQHYHELAGLIGLDPFALYKSSIHSLVDFVVGTYDGEWSISLAEVKDRNHIPYWFKNDYLAPARYCPACLIESGHHRRVWFAKTSIVCTKHLCPLQDECSQCGRPVSLNDIVFGRCGTCRCQMAAPSDFLHIDGLLEATQSQILLERLVLSPRRESRTKQEPKDSSAHDRYRTACRMAKWFSSHASHWQHLLHAYCHPKTLSILTRAYGSPTAQDILRIGSLTEMFTDWPANFHHFLTAMASGPMRQDNSFFRDIIVKDWTGAGREYLGKEAHQFFGEHPSLAGGFRSSSKRSDPFDTEAFLMNAVEAGQCFQLSTADMLSYITTAQEPQIGPFRDAKGRLYFNRTEVVKHSEKTGRWLDLKGACARLGLTRRAVVDLVGSGALFCIRRSGQKSGTQWKISLGSIEALLTRMSTHLLREGQKRDIRRFIPINKAIQRLSNTGLTTAVLVKGIEMKMVHVMNGPLNNGERTPHDAEVLLNMRDLFVLKDDLPGLAEKYRRTKNWLTLLEVAEEFGVKRTIVTKWMRAKLLTPVAKLGQALYFSNRQVYEFGMKHVDVPEAASILEIGPLVVQKWARNGRLHPVSGPGIDGCHRYLFDRQEVLRFTKNNRLTAPQYAKLAGYSRSHFDALIRAGVVKPVSGPGVDGSGHYLFLRGEGSQRHRRSVSGISGGISTGN